MEQIYILLFNIVLNRKPARYYIWNSFELSYRLKDIWRKKCGGKHWTYVSCVYIFICENNTFWFNNCVMPRLHYKNDINRASLKIGDSYKDVFKNICHEMCSVTTVAEYYDRKKWLEEIANIFPQITSWINWWDARKYHIFPAFRQLGYSNVTLAESGNSTLKWCTQLWLLEAVCDDTSTMLTQIHEVKSFLT